MTVGETSLNGYDARAAPPTVSALTPTPPTVSPADATFAEAQAAAKARSRFFGHVVVWGAVSFFFLVTGGLETASVIGGIWGIWLAWKGYHVVYAPDLEARFLKEELTRRQLRHDLTQKPLPPKGGRSLEELSASIAHEIRNPITAAKSLVQQMGEDPRSDENVEYAKIALAELDRVERSISHLLRYAREEAVAMEPVALTEVVDSALEGFRDRLLREKVEVVRDHDGPGAIKGDPEKLRRVLINLIGNAMDALAEGPTPSPRLSIQSGTNLAGTEIWLKVADNGPGIEADRLAKIWSPFHTSKQSGTGLGLAITKKLVESHGGQIEVQSEPNKGAEFTVTFPALPKEPSR